jgi:hypothetical protein
MAAMRRWLLAITVLGLVAPASALAASKPLTAVLAQQIRAINAAPKAAPVLLPRSLPLDTKHLYPSGRATGRSYDLELGAVKNCHGADACLVADFTASPGGTVFGKKVKVTGATRAGFTPLSCGASCAPPQIVFVVHGVRYTIQANLKKTAKGDRATLIAAAEAAIAAGPR